MGNAQTVMSHDLVGSSVTLLGNEFGSAVTVMFANYVFNRFIVALLRGCARTESSFCAVQGSCISEFADSSKCNYTVSVSSLVNLDVQKDHALCQTWTE